MDSPFTQVTGKTDPPGDIDQCYPGLATCFHAVVQVPALGTYPRNQQW